MDRVKATEIAARVWCDQGMAHIAMDPERATRIADILAEIDDVGVSQGPASPPPTARIRPHPAAPGNQ